jgi:hypothetical protein
LPLPDVVYLQVTDQHQYHRREEEPVWSPGLEAGADSDVPNGPKESDPPPETYGTDSPARATKSRRLNAMAPSRSR